MVISESKSVEGAAWAAGEVWGEDADDDPNVLAGLDAEGTWYEDVVCDPEESGELDEDSIPEC